MARFTFIITRISLWNEIIFEISDMSTLYPLRHFLSMNSTSFYSSYLYLWSILYISWARKFCRSVCKETDLPRTCLHIWYIYTYIYFLHSSTAFSPIFLWTIEFAREQSQISRFTEPSVDCFRKFSSTKFGCLMTIQLRKRRNIRRMVE